MIDWLKEEWFSLTLNYTNDEGLINELWQEIYNCHSEKSRYYHNLNHLFFMLKKLKDIKHLIVDYNAIRFSIWYHDIVYNSSKQNNEEKSAELAVLRLRNLGLDGDFIEKVQAFICSTKKHEVIRLENEDNAYLLDLDLAILGVDEKSYEVYFKSIRKEYSIYPDFLYNRGRKKVLLHFLDKDAIFLTEYFSKQFQEQAICNIKNELSLL